MKKLSKDFLKCQKCITQIVTDWNKTTLSDIEKWGLEAQLLHGVFHLAMYILETDEYFKLKIWCEDEYGFTGFSSSADE